MLIHFPRIRIRTKIVLAKFAIHSSLLVNFQPGQKPPMSIMTFNYFCLECWFEAVKIMNFLFKSGSTRLSQGNTILLFHISVLSCTIYSFFTLIWQVIQSKDEGRWWLKVFTGFSSFFTVSWTIYLHNWRWSTLLSSYQTFFLPPLLRATSQKELKRWNLMFLWTEIW